MAEHLSAQFPVLYVDPPLSFISAQKRSDLRLFSGNARLRLIRPGLARLTPIVQPFPARTGMPPLTSMLARQQIRQAIRQLGGSTRAIISAWPQFQVFGCCGERTRIYWAQDDFVGGAPDWGIDPQRLDAREQMLVKQADLIFAANPHVAEIWRRRGRHVTMIPFGADVDAYENIDRLAPVDVDLPAPVAGFIGHINERIDLKLLEAVADRGRSILLVGPHDPAREPEGWPEFVKRPNVRWVGQKQYTELPGYLRAIDVGLVPYKDSAFNRGSFPLKTLEYLAAGRAVVATSLPATLWLQTSLIKLADEPSVFADAVDQSFEEQRTKEVVEARQAFAQRHSWAHRSREVIDLMNSEAQTANVKSVARQDAVKSL